jgi:hypothetical protein
MGRDAGVRFLQSGNEFPVMVSLGREVPSWELRRWGRDCLRFSPVEQDRYGVRGNGRQLLYRGERESHRFTILDGDRFEYDIILKKPPASNKVYLRIEGWEGFDFFRQPDGFGPAHLRGSYAVYKREFILNSSQYHVGTGKFCHIHRPRIIDRRGREVWGALRIDRGMLTITIPEGWMGEARYPVLVDPVIGSNTIGAYRTFPYLTPYDYEWYLDDLARYPPGEIDFADYVETRRIYLDEQMALNRQEAPLKLQGTYNAYLYADETYSYKSGGKTVYYECNAWPMAFSSLNEKPKQLLLSNASSATVTVSPEKPAKWNKGTITFGTAVNAGTDMWFGFAGEAGIGCRFDYGSPYRGVYGYVIDKYWAEQGYSNFLAYMNDYGLGDIGGETDWLTDSNSDERNAYPGARVDFKISMYLELPPQSYVRTLTQGVKLTDTRKINGSYNRSMAHTVKGTTVLQRVETIIRKCVMNGGNGMSLQRFGGLYRQCAMTLKSGAALFRAGQLNRKAGDQAGTTAGLRNQRSMSRTMANQAAIPSGMTRRGDSKRSIGNIAIPGTELKRYAGNNRKLETAGAVYTGLGRFLTLPRRIAEGLTISEIRRTFQGIQRRISGEAGNTGAAQPAAGFRRDLASPVGIATGTARHPFFVRSIVDNFTSGAYPSYSVVWLRRLPEQESPTDQNRHIGGYIRGLYIAAGSLAETGHTGEYYRKQEETVDTQGPALRHLFMFVRLLSGGLVRDYLIRRFLKSKEDLVLKSKICREIVMESNLH